MSPTPLQIVTRGTSEGTAPGDVTPCGPAGVWACDFYVSGIEDGAEVPGGYRLGRLTNIDHHAPGARMAKRVSSATLARLQVLALGVPPAGDVVVVNHTDCDSVLSSGIMSGRLEPLMEFSDAAIAADHTGAANPIADLLQALDSRKDLDLSFAALERLLAGEAQPAEVVKALGKRLAKREKAREMVAAGTLQRIGGLYWGVLDDAVDGELFPALLPDATAIMLASPFPGKPGWWEVKVRLGLAAPEGLWLNRLQIDGFDPSYGGRWNAGSNKRRDGTELAPEAYAEHLGQRLSWYRVPA